MHALMLSPFTPNQVDASFVHSLLRVVPYDDCPSLPASGIDQSIVATTTLLTTSSSSSFNRHASTVGDPARTSVVSAGATDGVMAPTGGALRGGDVVRLCHLASAGFLTHEAVPETVQGGGSGGRIGEEDLAERDAARKKEVQCDGVARVNVVLLVRQWLVLRDDCNCVERFHSLSSVLLIHSFFAKIFSWAVVGNEFGL